MRAAQTPSAVDTVSQLEPARELTVDREVTRQLRARHRAGQRGAVAHSRHRRARPAARARQVSRTAASSRRPAAPCRCSTTTTWRCSGYGPADPRDHRPRAGCGLPHRRHADARRLVRHVGAVLLARRRMAAVLRARLPAARARPEDGGAGRLAAARPDLAQPLGRQDVAQRPGLCLVRAGQGRPRRSRPRPLLPGHEGRRDHRAASPGRSSPRR